MDWGGVVKLFSTNEIRRSLAMLSFWEESSKKSEGFYTEARLGSVCHYHNSFGAYIRCEVVAGETERSKGKLVKCLKPTAMVGEWRVYDLPHRRPDGSINYGYQAERIVKGECFEPHSSNIWESPDFERRGHPDPTTMPALDLSVPQMTVHEEVEAKLEQLRKQVWECLGDSKESPLAALKLAKTMLEGI
jgi:hypothetical protein